MNDHGTTQERWVLRGRPGYDQKSVLRGAVDVFNLHGYDATSMGNVAEILRISRSALYHHVTSKGELLRADIGYSVNLPRSAKPVPVGGRN